MNFKAQKRKGKLDINWEHINTYASRWADGTWFDIEIVRKQKKKSDPMRKWYWGAVLPKLLRGLGYDPEEDELVHRHMKIIFFRVKPDKRGIYREKDIPSVFGNKSVLDISQKQDYLSWVIRKAAEYGIYISNPGEHDDNP